MSNIIARRHAYRKCDFCKAFTSGISFYVSGRDVPKLSLCETCLKVQPPKIEPEQADEISSETSPLVDRQRKHILARYNLTPLEYQQMLAEQQGRCAACGEPEISRNTRDASKISILSVDHCHATGKVRGLLCRKCNMALGLLDDNPDKAIGLAEYIKKYQ